MCCGVVLKEELSANYFLTHYKIECFVPYGEENNRHFSNICVCVFICVCLCISGYFFSAKIIKRHTQFPDFLNKYSVGFKYL